MDDVRIKILRYHKNRNTSTEEHSSNVFLAKLSSDLGTIRRALLELVSEDYLIISNATKDKSIEAITRDFNTKNKSTPLSDEDILRKSSKRLVENVGSMEKIPEYKFFTTVKGLKFLIEFDKLCFEATMSRWQRLIFWPLLIVSFFISISQGIELFQKSIGPNSKHEVIHKEGSIPK